MFGWLSDKIGRKKVIMAGMALGIVALHPLFTALTAAANPALAEASERAPVTVMADPGTCSVQFDPIGKKTFDKTPCDIAAAALAKAGIPYETRSDGNGYITIGQRRIEAESARDQVRAAIVSAWGSLDAAKANVRAAQAQVTAAEVALTGVREEARVGQRTTLDVLNQQQELLNARVNLITAQRDRVVASYAVAQSIGRLTAASLGLGVQHYSAKQHFDQVKDLFWGNNTPDGR